METYLVLGSDLTQHRTGTFSSLTEREKIVSSLVQSIIQKRFLINANTENYDLLLPFVDEGHIPVIINFTDKDFAISDERLFNFLEKRNGTARGLSKPQSTEFKNDYALSYFDHGKVLHILKQQPEDLKRLYCTLETFKCMVRNTIIRILKDFLEKDDKEYTFIISLNQFECKECSYLDSANKSFTSQEFVLQYQMGVCDAVLFSCEDLRFIINLNGLHE